MRTEVQAAGFVPKTDWREVGNETAAAALESYLSAATGGDVERLAQLVHAGNPPSFSSFLGRLSDETRAAYGTPEKVAAMMISSKEGGFTAFQGAKITQSDSEGVIVTAQFTHEDGRSVGKVFWIRRTPEGFRINVNGPLMEEFMSGISRRPPFFGAKNIEQAK